MTITVYTKPSCGQCIATFRLLDQLSLEYQVVGDEHWSGFRPERIKAIKKEAA